MIRMFLGAFLVCACVLSVNPSAIAANYSSGITDVTISDSSSTGTGGAIYEAFINGSITNSNFYRNSSPSWGGAVYTGTVTGGVHGSFFSGNRAANGGGAGINSLLGGIHASTFSDNTATGLGGGIFSNTRIEGGIHGSSFLRNTGGNQGGGVWAAVINGDITDTLFMGNNAGSGAGLYTRALFGSIRNSTFQDNRATGNGGAATIDAMYTGSVIADSVFENNRAGNSGGALIAYSLDHVTISNSTFRKNMAESAGGALFLSTTIALAPGSSGTPAAAGMDVTLHADAGRETVFQGNRDSGGYNSLYFGRQGGGNSLIDAALHVTGAGRVELYDPIRVDMNNGHSFTFTQSQAQGGELIWGGINRITTAGSGSGAFFRFDSGKTTLLSNYSLQAGSGTDMDVLLGGGHTMILDLTDRDGSVAFLDFTRAGGGLLGTGNGTRLTVLRSLLGSEGRYLIVDGYTGGTFDINDIDFISVPGARYILDNSIPGQLWLEYIFNPGEGPAGESPDGDSPSGVSPAGRRAPQYRPNVRRALAALDQMLRHSDYGINMTDAAFEAFKADIDSTTPEAAVSMGLIGMQTHGSVTDMALRNAFALPAGRFQAGAASDGFQSLSSAAFTPRINDTLLRRRGNSREGREKWQEDLSGTLQRSLSRTAPLAWNPANEETRKTLAASLQKDGKASLKASEALGYTGAGLSTASTKGLWVGYVGNFASADGHRGYFGYDVDTHGALMGLNIDLSDRWTIGGYGGYTYTDVDFDGIRAEADSNGFHLGLLGKYAAPCGFSLTTDAAYSYFDTHVTRNPAGATSSKGTFGQHVMSLGLETAYTFEPWENGRLTPFVGARQTWSHMESFTEVGGMLAAEVKKAETSSFTTTVGTALAQDVMVSDRFVLTPALELAWTHEYGDRQVQTRGNTFVTPLITDEAPISFNTFSLPRDRDIFKVGASLQTMIFQDANNSVSLKAAYGLDIADNYTGHTVFAGFELRF